MDPLDLARWTRFAAKGGIGKCTALRDCIAQSQEDLMFLQDDEIVVLMQVTSQEGIYLGFCEGVVGKFSGVNVRFHGKLKKPIITRRPGSVTPSPVLTGRPVVSSPTPSDPSSPRFHNHTKTESESEHNAGETGPSGPSEQSHYSQSLNHSHSHSHGRGTPSYVHDQSSRSNTRANSAEGSDSPSIETPARRSEEQQSHLLAIEVVDERGRLSNPLSPSPIPIQHHHQHHHHHDGGVSELATRQEKDDGSAPAVPKPAPSHRHEVVSAIYVPFKQRTSSPEEIPEPQESAERSIAEDAQSGKSEPQEAILRQRKQRESHDLSSSSRQTPEERERDQEPTSAGTSTEEPFSPASQYTKEGGASDESHIVRDSAAISDGGFGIGLSLLQGLADGDRSSVSWSESGHDHEERNVRQSIPNPPAKLQPQEETVPVPTSPNELTALVNVSAWNNSRISDMSAFSTASAGRKESVKSESEAGDGLQWNDDDIFDDYRYSRYSVASKGSKQSRSSTVPSLLQNSKVPPLPEEGRPSLEGRVSIRYTDSPRSGTPSSLPPFARGLPPLESGRPSLDSQASSKSTDSLQPALGAILAAPKPLNIIKNVGRGPSPNGSPGSFDHEDIRTRTASNTPLGMASIMREQIDNELKSVNQFTTSITTPRQSEDRHTPTPSVESLHIESSTMDTLPPTTSNDYNGDESSTEEPSPVEMETHAPDNNNNAAAFLSLDTSESRTSLFLPHPGAPKPVTNNGQVTPRTPAIYSALSSGSSGPSSPPPVSRAPLNNGIPEMPPAPPASPLHNALSQAAQKARSVQGTTLYASTQLDLLSSFGPVPIIFSLDQLPPPSPRTPDLGIPRPPASPRLPSPLGLGMDASNMINRGSSPQPIPRANFFPTAGGPRPRSRSFSGFSMNNMDGPEVLFPLGSPGRSREEGSQPAARTDLADYRASLRGSSPLGSGPRSQSRSPSRGPSRNQRPAHVPSPLSLPAINNPSTSSPNASSVPLPRSPNVNPPSPSANSFGPGPGRNGPGSMRGRVLRQVSSSSAIRPTNNAPPEFVSSNQPPPDFRQPPPDFRQPPPDFRETSPTKPSPRRSTSQAVPPKLSYEDPEGRPDIALPNQNGGAPMTRSLSLKQKLSMSGLRSKVTTGRPSRDGDNTMNLTSPISNGSHEEEDRVQIKDMEFELVKPNIRPNGYRGSEDGMGHITSPIETGSVHSGLEGRGGQWRSESPAFSPAAAHLRSPLRSQSVDSFARPGQSGSSPPGATQAISIEAHRMREQKWMSLISATPSSQARKSKKVKKLLLEGVPSSVRGRVWGHVIDSHARRMQGLFGQLVQKAPKKFVPLVEQDIERCFSDVPHLRDPRGSLSQVILAYTAMVPDIRYRTGLTRIAGHLLLQAPDEDAFWIFVAVMDNLLRGYYHVTNTGQFEIDASLFQNLVETAEPELAKFLFNDYGIRPIDICGSWFSSLFAGVLPPDHLYRVWDILFYEGSIYLFRVALTILTMCKNTLLSLNPGRAGPEAIVDILSRPPPTAIPQDPEAFLNYTFTVKVRDDDLRKQRSKKEAQWKKERLSQR